MSSDTKNDQNNWSRVRILGSGAFGVVELWKNEITQENIAIKKCHQTPNDKTNDKKWTRWTREVCIMNELNHPNIVATKKIPEQLRNSDNGLPALCMEYCTKGDLRSMLNNCDNFCGIEHNDALRIMHGISSAVEYLHSNQITHRDLKPENIVIQKINDKVIYKLIDLGYAKNLGDQSISASIVGTLNYLAPELLWCDKYSCSVDYWSLGILFYEVWTGFRPFLPNMQITETWMRNVKDKKREHISAREVGNTKVEFYSDFEEPHSVPNSIKEDLVEWFRLVLQWDPKKRGKLASQTDNSDKLVFSTLKSIFEKKIVSCFIVSSYKYESFVIDSNSSLADFKQVINDNEDITPDEQIMTDSMGTLLTDDFFSTATPSELVIVFNSNKLEIENIPQPIVTKPIKEMMLKPRKQCNYYNLRRYYGATVVFMNREIQLYRSYVLALSIMIDLCDTKCKSLEKDINILQSNVQLLIKKFECISSALSLPTSNEEKILDSYKTNFAELKIKINKFFEGSKQVNENMIKLEKRNNELKLFSDVNWISDLEEPYHEAVKLITNWQSKDRNQRYEPLRMVECYFKFLLLRGKKLTDARLIKAAKDILHFVKQLTKLKEVLKSFTALLNDYSHDINALNDQVCDSNEVQEMNLKKSSDIDTLSQMNTSKIMSNPTDTVVYEAILMRNMLGGLLVEMDVWKRKYADLNFFDG